MSKIDEIKERSPFKVPENYFEEFNRKVIASTAGQVQEQEETPAKKSLYRTLRPFLLAAASVALLAVLGYGTVRIFFSSQNEQDLSGMSYEDLTASAMADIDISSLEESTGIIQFTEKMPEISSPELIDCLLAENINITDIYQIY